MNGKIETSARMISAGDSILASKEKPAPEQRAALSGVGGGGACCVVTAITASSGPPRGRWRL